MSDKNNTSAEDYLDSLLRSIMGEDTVNDNSSKITEDISSDDPFDFGKELGTQGLEEDFLSDFEKEFFDEEESKMMASLMNEVKQVESEMKPEPAHDMDINLMSFDDEFDVENFHFEETMAEPEQPQTVDEPQMSDELQMEVSPELLFDGFEEFDDIDEMGESAALVEQAVDKGDADVEDDLKGLYGILGVDGESEELPEDVAAPKKKKKKKEKKGFFDRLFGGKKKKKSEGTPLYDIVDEDESGDALSVSMSDIGAADGDGLDAMSLDDDMDLASAFDMLDALPAGGGGASATADDSGEYTDFDDAFGFGLDDSAFDALGGGGNESENDMLIRQMDHGGANSFFDEDDDENEKDETKGKKGKKGKKEKRPKAAKKAKPKKAKKAKAPKEKKTKEPDEIIDVPFIYVIFLISFVVVAVLGASMGGDYYNYQQKVYEAVKLYVDTDQTDIDKYESRYSEAYSLLSGLKMRDKDHKVFFNQVQTIMFMDIHYESYKNYMLLDDYEHGLDSLIKAVKMYDKYQNTARELGCFDDMTVILGWVDDKLNNVYGITTSRARELYMIEKDKEYATVVRAIAAEAEKNAANKAEAETKTDETEGIE